MSIEIKKSQKPVKYEDALRFMEKRLLEIDQNKSNDLIWTLEHEDIYTAGTTYNENEVLDKSIKILKTNRGGKITYHGPGQLICYFVIDLKKYNPKLNIKFYTFNAETLNIINKNINLKNIINEYSSINVIGWLKKDYSKAVRIFLKSIHILQIMLYSTIFRSANIHFKGLERFPFKLIYKNNITLDG